MTIYRSDSHLWHLFYFKLQLAVTTWQQCWQEYQNALALKLTFWCFDPSWKSVDEGSGVISEVLSVWRRSGHWLERNSAISGAAAFESHEWYGFLRCGSSQHNRNSALCFRTSALNTRKKPSQKSKGPKFWKMRVWYDVKNIITCNFLTVKIKNQVLSDLEKYGFPDE